MIGDPIVYAVVSFAVVFVAIAVLSWLKDR